jgi:hypothetical protein
MARTFTRDELKAYDGQDGRPTYAAFQGKVYDVSTSPLWEEGQHFEHGAGRDLTDELADAPHGEEVFGNVPIVGDLVDRPPAEKRSTVRPIGCSAPARNGIHVPGRCGSVSSPEASHVRRFERRSPEAGMLIDLHAHTTASDGALAPAALVDLACRQGVGVLGITDHDTVAGVEEALAAGERLGVEVIPGVEISCHYQRHEVHLLGYFIDHRHAALLERLAAWRQDRLRRLHEMVDRLERLGIRLDSRAILAKAHGAVGRPHVAMALVEGGHVASVEEAFDRFLADGKRAYVPRERVPVEEGIALVRTASGLPVLAHPGIYRNDGMIHDLAGKGLAGIEVLHSDHGDAAAARYRRMAARLGLLCTGGSDFHGLPGAAPQALGRPSLPLADLEALRARRPPR